MESLKPLFSAASFSSATIDKDHELPPGLAPRRSASLVLFVAAWLFVGLVSAYDAFLIVKYQHLIHDFELNPVGRWIMKLQYLEPISDTSGVATFLGCKFAGTIIVLGVMMILYWRSERMGLTVVGALATFQATLAAFLTLA